MRYQTCSPPDGVRTRRVVSSSAGLVLAAERGQQSEGVEPGGQAREIDTLVDRDTGQESVTVGHFGAVSVDIEDDETCWTAGHSDSERGVTAPPGFRAEPGSWSRRGSRGTSGLRSGRDSPEGGGARPGMSGSWRRESCGRRPGGGLASRSRHTSGQGQATGRSWPGECPGSSYRGAARSRPYRSGRRASVPAARMLATGVTCCTCRDRRDCLSE